MPVFNALFNPEVSVECLVVRIPAFAVQEMAGSGLYGGGTQRMLQLKTNSENPFQGEYGSYHWSFCETKLAFSSLITRMFHTCQHLSFLICVIPALGREQLCQRSEAPESLSLVHSVVCFSVLCPATLQIYPGREGKRFTS